MTRFISLTLICSLISLVACSAAKAPELPEKTYSVANQQSKRPRVYYPVRSVRSSSPGASEYLRNPARKVIMKKFFYDLPDSTLCDVGQALASSLGYGYYCAPSLIEKKYAVSKLLTAYELRDLMEAENNVKVLIDNVNRDIRILSNERIVPRFAK